MISQYCVTYESDYETFIVHQEASALPDMKLRMHKSGLHLFYSEDINNLVIMNTAEENMKSFTKRDVEGSKAARKLYDKLLYRSRAEFKWLIKSNQIKNCDVSVWNIDTAQDIWRMDISALKVNTVQGKPTVVALDRIKIPK